LTARVVPQLSAAVEGLGIAPGDLIFGDREGRSSFRPTWRAKRWQENKVATAIRGGMSAREAFESFGVL
jgi:hypothetical protein